MYRILMDVCCLNSYSEPLPGKGKGMELVIENLVALVLLDLFELAEIEGIRVFCQPAAATRPALCSFQVQASCPLEAVSQPAASLEARLEDTISCALLQHFSLVIINGISVHPERTAALDLAALPHSA